MSIDDNADIFEMTADIVSAYVGNNSISAADLPALIQNVHRALSGINLPPEPVEVAFTEPAVRVR